MKDELDSEAYQPQYPPTQTLGRGFHGSTQLCYDPYREGSQVVQKLFTEQASRQVPDIVDHGLAKLQGAAHPYLALVRDFGWEASQAFLVREWIQGSALSQILPKLQREEVLGIIRQLLETLCYLFNLNILHLHLKPENLIIVQDAELGITLKLTDFGLNQILHRPSPVKELSVGTLPYTAPEYYVSPHPDPRADLYSIGVLSYWALSGKLPYSGEDPRTILEVQKKSEPAPLEKTARVESKISDWVQSLIQPSPQDRPQDPFAAYRAFSDAVSGVRLKGATISPLLFSDSDQIFRRKMAVKTLRRIVQMGRRWAIQGPPGAGKSFFARWLQRSFWNQGMRAVLYEGREIAQLQGEGSPGADERLFVLIDNADQGPVPAWLEARPYPDVIVFGEDLAWAQADPEWKFHNLENLGSAEVGEIYRTMFGKNPQEGADRSMEGHQGNPGAMVGQARSLARLGVIAPSRGTWAIQEDAFKGIPPGKGRGALGPIVESLTGEGRRALTLLSMAQAPLTSETLAEWLDMDAEKVRENLLDWTHQDWIIRRLWWGREFFQSRFSSTPGLPAGVTEEDVLGWSLGLEELGWYLQAKQILERSLTTEKLQRDTEVILGRCRLAGLTGEDEVVLQNITPTFFRGLSEEQRGPAYEVLGRSYAAAGKGAEAESVYKKAFACYRSAQDIAGQVQVLMDLGSWYGDGGDPSRAIKIFENALALAEKLPEPSPLRGQAHLEVGRFYQGVTDYSKAEEQLSKSIEHFLNYRQYHLLAKAYQVFASVYADQGEFAMAEHYGREALSIASFKEDWMSMGAIFNLLSRVEESRGNPAGTLERLSEAVFVLERWPAHPLLGDVLGRRANFYEKNRQLEKARRDSDRLLQLGNTRGNTSWIVQARMTRGKIARRDASRLDDARREFQKVLKLLSGAPSGQNPWECLYELGEVERNLGNPQAARSHYESALSHLRQYVRTLPPKAQEHFLKDGKKDQIEMALRWLRT